MRRGVTIRMAEYCKNGHEWSEANTVMRNGIRACLTCQRSKTRKTKVNSGRRTKPRPRATQEVPAGRRVSLHTAIEHVVFEHVKVSTAARWAGKAKKTVADGAWEHVKRIVRERDRDTCQKCGSRRPGLDVHHRKPKQMGGSDSLTTYGLANLISLCRLCHGWVHGHPIEAEELGLMLAQSADPERVYVTVRGRKLALTNAGLVGKGVRFSEAQDRV